MLTSNQNTTYSETIEGVRAFLDSIPSHTDKLRHILGLRTTPNAPNLAQYIIVNCVDTEHYEWDKSKLTEIGINSFQSQDLRKHANDPKANAKSMLQDIYYYHFRMLPNTHCINKKFCPGNPEANRFGNTRFATYAEGKAMLTECFEWNLNQSRSQDGKCPIILLGHALHNDTGGLADIVDFNPYASGTIVAALDTQRMAREMRIYNPKGSQHEISLRDLTAHFDIPYRDPHTAGNDAAYTTISAIYMALYGRNEPMFGESVEETIDDVETSSCIYSKATHGIARYCTRCHRKNHFKDECRAHLPPCHKCQARRVPGKDGKLPKVHWFTAGRKAHLPEDCTWGSQQRSDITVYSSTCVDT